MHGEEIQPRYAWTISEMENSYNMLDTWEQGFYGQGTAYSGEAVCLLVTHVTIHKIVFCESDYCYRTNLSGINLRSLGPIRLAVSARNHLM